MTAFHCEIEMEQEQRRSVAYARAGHEDDVLYVFDELRAMAKHDGAERRKLRGAIASKS
jgi:hypothetical protein